MNPWGDILTIARAWCVTTDNAKEQYLFLNTYEDCKIKISANPVEIDRIRKFESVFFLIISYSPFVPF